jgi:hypothetical protein
MQTFKILKLIGESFKMIIYQMRRSQIQWDICDEDNTSMKPQQMLRYNLKADDASES